MATKQDAEHKIPAIAANAVLAASSEMPADARKVQGYDFDRGLDYDALLKSFRETGFQATNFGLAVDEINKMIDWRPAPEDIQKMEEDGVANPSEARCKIFFGYTSNMISCGVREVIRYVVKHKMVDYIVTTGGGIEEDFMKCMNPHYMGDFKLRGEELRKKGINRIGNLLVPNKNYCAFEDWLNPILDKMLEEQKKDGTVWSPSLMIARLGKEINHEESVYYWCWKNNIPVFCPAITDGSVGDMMYFHSYKNPGLICDIASDIRRINDASIHAIRTGMLILGGGLVKHHICNANLMRNGADYSVFVNTGHEFDGSDSGAAPDEAVSWGKIKMTATPVKICADASYVFPLLAAQTFVDAVQKRRGRAQVASTTAAFVTAPAASSAPGVSSAPGASSAPSAKSSAPSASSSAPGAATNAPATAAKGKQTARKASEDVFV